MCVCDRVHVVHLGARGCSPECARVMVCMCVYACVFARGCTFADARAGARTCVRACDGDVFMCA